MKIIATLLVAVIAIAALLGFSDKREKFYIEGLEVNSLETAVDMALSHREIAPTEPFRIRIMRSMVDDVQYDATNNSVTFKTGDKTITFPIVGNLSQDNDMVDFNTDNMIRNHSIPSNDIMWYPTSFQDEGEPLPHPGLKQLDIPAELVQDYFAPDFPGCQEYGPGVGVINCPDNTGFGNCFIGVKINGVWYNINSICINYPILQTVWNGTMLVIRLTYTTTVPEIPTSEK